MKKIGEYKAKYPLHAAIYDTNYKLKAFEELLNKASTKQLNAYDDDGFTPLQLAVIYGGRGRSGAVALLLEQEDIEVNKKDRSGNLLLSMFFAVYFGKANNAQRKIWSLLVSRVDHQLTNDNGNTALHYLSGEIGGRYSDLKKEELLEEYLTYLNENNQADILLQTPNRQDQKYDEVRYGNKNNGEDFILELNQEKFSTKLKFRQLTNEDKFDKKSGIKAKKENYPLHIAIYDNDLDKVKELLNQNKENPDYVNAYDDDGFTPLQLAVIYHCEKIFDELLQVTNLDINKKAREGNTPLIHLAIVKYGVRKSNSENYIFEKLIKHPEIDFTLANDNGNTALHCLDSAFTRHEHDVGDSYRKIIKEKYPGLATSKNKLNQMSMDEKKARDFYIHCYKQDYKTLIWYYINLSDEAKNNSSYLYSKAKQHAGKGVVFFSAMALAGGGGSIAAATILSLKAAIISTVAFGLTLGGGAAAFLLLITAMIAVCYFGYLLATRQQNANPLSRI